MKRLISTFVALVMIFSCAACNGGQSKAPTENELDIVAIVNGENILRAELDYFSGRLRGALVNELYARNPSFDGNLDTAVIGGKSFAAELHAGALDECVRAKIKLVLMRENGVFDDIGYFALKSKAENFNKSNEGKSEIVGIKSISLDTFYTYYIDTGEMELKNLLETTAFAVTDSEVDAYIASSSDIDGDELETARNSARRTLRDRKYDEYIDNLVNTAKITEA